MVDYSKVMVSGTPKKVYDKMVPIQVGKSVSNYDEISFKSLLRNMLSNLSEDQINQLKRDLHINF